MCVFKICVSFNKSDVNLNVNVTEVEKLNFD